MVNSKLRQHWPILALGFILLLAFLEMAWLSIARYRGFNATAFDLGVMSQAIWSVTQGKLLLFSQEGIIFSRLARHVELIYFLVAPFYALWPSPITLLTIQALWYALGAIPVYRLARRHLHYPRPTLMVVLVYLFYPVAQTSVLFDFHGDTLAMPFLFFMFDSLDTKAWRSYAVWLLLALSCKMYVAIAVVLLGVVLWLKGERKAALWSVGAAVIWGTIAFFLIRSWFAPPEAEAVSATATSYVTQYFGGLNLTNTWSDRLFHAIIVFLPILPLAPYALTWFFPGFVLAAAVLLTSGTGPTYSYQFHHYALAVPFFIMAIIVGAGNRLQQQEMKATTHRGRKPLAWRLQIAMVLLITLYFNAAVVNAPLNPYFYRTQQYRGRLPARYGVTSRDIFLDEWFAANIPAQAPLMANGVLATHLTNRSILYLSEYNVAVRPIEEVLPEVEYFLLDLFPDPLREEHFSRWQKQLTAVTSDPTMHLNRSEAGLLLFARQGDALPFSLDPAITNSPPVVITSFYDHIGLVSATATPVGNRRWQLEYTWIRLSRETTSAFPSLLAMTIIEGWDRGRIPHPATLITPPAIWLTAVPIRETITIELPADLPSGHYPLSVNWYNYEDLLKLVNQTNPDDTPVATLTLEIP